MSFVKIPIFKVEIDGVNISEDIKEFVTSISVSDSIDGESDEVTVKLQDYDRRFQNDWFPTKGDKLVVAIGYKDEGLMPDVKTEIDEPTFEGSWSSGDTCEIKGTAVPIKKELKTKRTKSYEDKSLKEIAESVASKNGLTLVGKVKDIKFDRQSQRDQTDLEYLKSLALKYGQIVKIESGEKLAFYDMKELDSEGAVGTLDRTDMSSWRCSFKSSEKYKDSEVKYSDPRTKKLHKGEAKSTGSKAGDGGEDITANKLIVRETVENEGQAKAIAEEKLRKANNDEVELEITLMGRSDLLAGSNLDITGLGKLSGKYQIQTVKHTLSRSSGWVSNVNLEKR